MSRKHLNTFISTSYLLLIDPWALYKYLPFIEYQLESYVYLASIEIYTKHLLEMRWRVETPYPPLQNQSRGSMQASSKFQYIFLWTFKGHFSTSYGKTKHVEWLKQYSTTKELLEVLLFFISCCTPQLKK